MFARTGGCTWRRTQTTQTRLTAQRPVALGVARRAAPAAALWSLKIYPVLTMSSPAFHKYQSSVQIQIKRPQSGCGSSSRTTVRESDWSLSAWSAFFPPTYAGSGKPATKISGGKSSGVHLRTHEEKNADNADAGYAMSRYIVSAKVPNLLSPGFVCPIIFSAVSDFSFFFRQKRTPACTSCLLHAPSRSVPPALRSCFVPVFTSQRQALSRKGALSHRAVGGLYGSMLYV